MPVRILVVDDEPAVRASLDLALSLHGYQVLLAADGDGALSLIDAEAPDAVVLDYLIPGPPGPEVCRRLRTARNRIPILMLTARDHVNDRVAGLDAGADDYLVKPFELEELLARLRALLRRATDETTPETLRFADLLLDTRTRNAHRSGRTIELTRTEFLLLELFMNNPRRVLTRPVILDRVWGYEFGPSSNSLDVYIGLLRRKTEGRGEPRLIHTMRGVGYVLRQP